MGIRSQASILKQIKQLIKEYPIENIHELYKVDLLLLKVIAILNYNQFEENRNTLDFSVLERWGKIGLWLLERSTQTVSRHQNRVREKFIQHIEKVTAPITALIYANIAHFLANSDSQEKVFSEKLLDISRKICDKFSHVTEARNTSKLINTILFCVEAKLAWDKGEIKQSIALIEVAQDLGFRYSPCLFKMLHTIGQHYNDSDPSITKNYFEKALTLLKTANERELSLEKYYCDEMQIWLGNYAEEKLKKLKDEMIEAFPACKMYVNANNISAFLPFEKVPSDDIQLPKRAAIGSLQKRDIPIMRGFQFCILSDDPKKVIASIKQLIEIVEQKNNNRPLAPSTSLPLTLTPVVQNKVMAPYQAPKPRQGKKTKTRGQSKPSSTSSTTHTNALPVPLPPKKRLVKDYGFKECANDEMATPLYFSAAHKKSGNNPEIILSHDLSQCSGLSNDLLEKVNGLFNPDGVIQARELNESGFKIDPAYESNIWIVRGKLIGYGGSKRIYFAPCETIEEPKITSYRAHKVISK